MTQKEIKRKKRFFAGLLFLAIGFWMIFLGKDNLGFIPAIIGSILALWKY